MKFPVAIALCMGLTAFTPAQQSSSKSLVSENNQIGFAQLKGHRQGSGAMLMWSMMNNAVFQDYRIESTYEDPTDPYSVWSIRGYVENDGGRMHQFRDANLLPGTVYYRIYARFEDGTMVCSRICTVKLVRH